LEKLAEFYQRILVVRPCRPKGTWLSHGSKRRRASPARTCAAFTCVCAGHGEAGPTLEIFEYNRYEERPATAINRPGLGHIALR